jgi:hypothetical protein
MWKSSSNAQPPIVGATGDEIKLNTPGSTAYVNSDLPNYNCKFTVAGGMNDLDKETVRILSGAAMDFAQVTIGHGSSTDKGQWGKADQRGGTVKAEKLVIGMYGTRGKAVGQYIISGGTLTSNAAMSTNSGRLLVGTGFTTGGTGCTTANSEGTFTIVGADATIDMKELYVGGYSTFVGTGNLNFKVKAAGVSAITVTSTTLLAAGAANLNVSVTGSYSGTILLVENTGTSAVAGVFDSLNGSVGAAEGTEVLINGYAYTLTYLYAAGADEIGNDIALIPEPATIALLSLGLIAIRRKK